MTSAHHQQSRELDFIKKILNGVFQTRKRLARIAGTDAAERSLEAIEEAFLSEYPSPTIGFVLLDPIGEKYADTRSDVQASLAGESNVNLRIVETMKPIISMRTTTPDGAVTSIIIQQGIVVVRGDNEANQSSIRNTP